jgi:excisionase family DNA binding protein
MLQDEKEAAMQDERIAVDINEAAKRLSLSARTVATLVSRGDLPSFKIGRARRIRVRDLERLCARDHKTGDAEVGRDHSGKSGDNDGR